MRETEKEKERERERECVCVYVCVRERHLLDIPTGVLGFGMPRVHALCVCNHMRRRIHVS